MAELLRPFKVNQSFQTAGLLPVRFAGPPSAVDILLMGEMKYSTGDRVDDDGELVRSDPYPLHSS